MDLAPKLVNHRSDDSSMRARGSSSPTLLVALLFFLVAVGGIVTWLLFAPPTSHETPPAPKVEQTDRELAPSTATQGADPTVVPTPPADANRKFENGMDGLTRVEVVDGKRKTKTTVDTYPLKGEVVDADTNEPVYYFWLHLIPPEQGDVVEASKGRTPNRFRNGQFALERQPAGVYNILCESQEHDAWKGQIKIPYEGDLRIRLKRATAIIGTVTDSSQTPLEGIDMQLVVDAARLDGGADPPTTRLNKTDKMGHYAFHKIPSGVYGLKAILMSDELENEPEFRVDAGATVIRDVSLQRMGAIKVTVKNIADQPVVRAVVSLVAPRDDGRERTVRRGSTDLRGVARLDFVRDGSYKLRVATQGFENWEQEIAVSSADAFREVPVQLQVAQKSGH